MPIAIPNDILVSIVRVSRESSSLVLDGFVVSVFMSVVMLSLFGVVVLVCVLLNNLFKTTSARDVQFF